MKLCVFDVDGTLVQTKSGATFRKSADDWQWLPGRLEKIKTLRENGVKLAVATNQGGVAFGYFSQSEILAELTRMCKQAGFPKGGIYVCYTHPKASVDQYRAMEDHRRKPGPSMLLEAMDDFSAEPEETLYVGDRIEDEQAAKKAGISFMWADKYFS